MLFWLSAAIVLALFDPLGFLTTRATAGYRGTRRRLERIRLLPVPEARALAIRLLEKPGVFNWKIAKGGIAIRADVHG